MQHNFVASRAPYLASRTTQVVGRSAARCAPRFVPRRTPITGPEQRDGRKIGDGEPFLLRDVQGETVGVRRGRLLRRLKCVAVVMGAAAAAAVALQQSKQQQQH